MGLGKVVDVAPVWGHRPGGGFGLDEAADGGGFAHPGRAEGKEVVAGLVDANTKAHGVQGARLADHFGQVFQVGSAGKLELGRITAPQ